MFKLAYVINFRCRGSIKGPERANAITADIQKPCPGRSKNTLLRGQTKPTNGDTCGSRELAAVFHFRRFPSGSSHHQR